MFLTSGIDSIQNFTVILDTIQGNIALSDTVKISILENSKSFFEHPLIIALVVAVATIIGVWIGQKLQRRTLKEIYNEQGFLNRDKELFVMRMNGCLQISEAISEVYHVTVYKKDGRKSEVFPSAYVTYKRLKEWNNGSTKLVDRKLLLLDQESYSKFTDLNRLVLAHLDEVEESGKPEEEWDKICREIGRRDRDKIQNTQTVILKSMRDFIKAKYDVELENVR